MTTGRILTASEVDSRLLESFLSRFYSPAKASFLNKHGDWWYRGAQNRWVILEGSEIAGYCGVIPGRLVSSGETIDTVWWVDLVIAPEFRGRGLQRDLDERVKSRTGLIVGFPNALAAEIHRRHGWGVHEDLRTLLMPLKPGEVGAVRRLKGTRGRAMRIAAMAMGPVATLFRRRLERWNPPATLRTDRPSPFDLEEICARPSSVEGYTTYRDKEYLQWRFFDAPYADDLSFFRSGEEDGPRVMAITRTRQVGDTKVVRVLDLFGAIGDRPAVKQVILAIGREAVRQGAVQVTAMASNRQFQDALRSLGFIAGTASRFCWWSSDSSWMPRLDRDDNYWVMADSDNDEP